MNDSSPSSEIKRFLVLGYQRSGTTGVFRAIQNHPDTSVFPTELWSTGFFGENLKAWTAYSPSAEDIITRMPRLYEVLISQEGNPMAPVRGAKCNFDSFEGVNVAIDKIRTWMPNIHLIYLQRNDLVAQWGSHEWARQTGRMHPWEKQKRSTRSVKLNRGDLKGAIADRILTTRAIKELQIACPFLKIDFENELQSNPKKNLGKDIHISPITESRWSWNRLPEGGSPR
jgi:hypothetical protein